MKATRIYYKKLISLGNYENEEIGIELEIAEGEKASDVLEKAKEFVEQNNPKQNKLRKIEQCKRIVENPNAHSHTDFVEAEMFLANLEASDDLPF